MVDFLVQEMRIRDNEKGQSAVEFILTVAFALGMTFLFVNQALNLTAGYLAHYQNFKAARAYFTFETGVNNQQTNLTQAIHKVEKVFNNKLLEAFGAEEGKFKVITNRTGSAIFSGTVFQFKMPISTLPFVGGEDKALLYSESFLGKEPTRVICQEMVCAAISGDTKKCSSGDMDIVLYDNGC